MKKNNKKVKSLYFEFPSDEKEIFEKFSKKLFDIEITDDKTYWLRPFETRSYIYDKNNEKIRLKINLSPNIYNYLITDENEQKTIDIILDNIWDR